jgi:DNA repair exonuclease SbcCD nuclease subunit
MSATATVTALTEWMGPDSGVGCACTILDRMSQPFRTLLTVTRFIHTADWQLGMTRRFLSAEAQARFTGARIDAIRSIGHLARQHEARFVVVGGDVFETNQVERQIVARALDAMGEFQELTFYLLPGNHDPFDPGSVFTSPTFTDKCPSNVVVLSDSTPVDSGHDIDIIGAPWVSKRPNEDLVARATGGLDANGTVRVVVGHGAVDTLSPDPNNPALISLSAIDAGLNAGQFHYVALGDRHSTTSVGTSGRVWYSGAPEPTDFREIEPGNVLLIDLDDAGIEVTSLSTATWRFVSGDFELSGPDDCKAVAAFLDDIADKPTTVVKLGLVGQLSLATHGDLELALDHRRDLLAGLQISSSRSDLIVLPDDQDLADMGLRGFGGDALNELLDLADSEVEGAEATVARDALGLLYRLQRGVA